MTNPSSSQSHLDLCGVQELYETVLVSHESMEELPCTNFRANGANMAPWAGLIIIMPTSVTTPDTNSGLSYLATPPGVDPSALLYFTGNTPVLML